MTCFKHAMLILFWLPVSGFAQNAPASYAGEQARTVKALSPEHINAYLEGQGMGLAKAAELNHYPGPKHVLELSQKLRLSAQEISNVQAVYDKMHAGAVRVGKDLVDKETKLDALFASGTISDEQLVTAVHEIARLHGELRIIHLRAHLETRKLLSAEQSASYDTLRGYQQSTDAHHHNSQQHH